RVPTGASSAIRRREDPPPPSRNRPRKAVRSVRTEAWRAAPGRSEAQHVAHGIEACGLLHHPAGRPEGAPRQAIAALGPVHQLEPLAQAAEHDGVVSDGVAGAQRDDADLLLRARTDVSLAREPRRLVE